MSGHALGAAGVHEAIYTLIQMNNDFMAESANIEDLVDEAEGMNIREPLPPFPPHPPPHPSHPRAVTKRKDEPFKRAMSNSFGFGGTNCALVIDKWEE